LHRRPRGVPRQVKLLARLLLVFALLSAQAGGIAHEIWHASSLAAADLDADGKAPKGNPLCDFHTALGSLSAALSCAHPAPEVVVQANPSLVGAESSAPRFALLAARSRGPPALL